MALDVGMGELLKQLGTDIGTLVRQELALARKEMKEALETLRTATVLVASGAVLSLLALGTLIAAAVLALGANVGYGTAALIVGVVLTAIAAGAVIWGVRRLRSLPVKPEKTLESLEETKEWMKDLT
ncbi:MAG TPA: phage holin family protein [Candidatus Polarisedimenticolaceae bacterium]|nr:phage holin family protein [Candidatus Polarisedimenticolaceae bacterium]